MKKKRLIPFGLLPMSWGLKGKLRQIAEAEYYYEGEELQSVIDEIEIQHMPKDSKEYRLASLAKKHKQKELGDVEYEKEVANIQNEPWVIVKNIETDPESPSVGSIELDWNDAFVEMLEEKGYGPSPSQEEVVDEWLSELCRNIALDRFDGVGDFSERIDQINKSNNDDVIYRKDSDSE